MFELKKLLWQFLTPTVTIPELSEIPNWDDLDELWRDYAEDIPKRCIIERQMIEHLATITDLNFLANILLDQSDDDTPSFFVERRIAEVLPTVNDWSILDNIPCTSMHHYSVLRYLVEHRIAEMISSVTVNNVPDWFIKYLKSPGDISPYLLSSTLAKAKELALSIV